MGAGLAVGPAQCADGESNRTCCQRGGGFDDIEFIRVSGACCERDFSMSDDEVNDPVDDGTFRPYGVGMRQVPPALQQSAWGYPYPQGKSSFVNLAQDVPPRSWHDLAQSGSPCSPTNQYLHSSMYPPEAYAECSRNQGMPRSESLILRAQYLHGGTPPHLSQVEDIQSPYQPLAMEYDRAQPRDHGSPPCVSSKPLAADRVRQPADCMHQPVPTAPAFAGNPGYVNGCSLHEAIDALKSTNHLPAPAHHDAHLPPSAVPTGRGGAPNAGFSELDVTLRRNMRQDELSGSRMFSAPTGQMSTIALPMVMMDD